MLLLLLLMLFIRIANIIIITNITTMIIKNTMIGVNMSAITMITILNMFGKYELLIKESTLWLAQALTRLSMVYRQIQLHQMILTIG